MHNYESAHGTLPPAAVRSTDGTPLLSWRVAILPFIEQDALYKEFKLDEPWDSEHNKKLIAKMPKLYGPARGQAKEGETFYQRFSGPGFSPDAVDVITANTRLDSRPAASELGIQLTGIDEMIKRSLG